MLKRAFDLVGATVGLIVLSPILVGSAIAIAWGSPGPIFYRGERVGLWGKPFRIFKFRTMVIDADTIGGPSTAAGDVRITRVGAFLRAYKLDELPQLLNVLTGEMSIVGPRPEVQRYVDMFSDEECRILTVRPGITDFASLWNADEGAVLAGAKDPEQAYMERIRPEKIRLQLEYVRQQSMLTDLRILKRTFAAVIFRPTPEAVKTLDEKR